MTPGLATRPRLLGRRELSGLLEGPRVALVTGALAVCVGYLLFSGHHLLAEAFAISPLIVFLVARPLILLLALGASIPALMSVTGGTGGYHVALSDLLLAMLVAVIAADSIVAGSKGTMRALRPVAFAVAPYAVFVLLVLSFHLGVRELAQTAQRYELFLFPLAVGAYAALLGEHERVLRAYVVATTVLACLWPLSHFGLQKNPVGQLFGNAILLLVALPALRKLTPCLFLLIPALLYTESRGAIGATLVGVAIILVFRGFEFRLLRTRVLPLAVVGVVTFMLLPGSLRARVTTLSPGTNTPAAYSLHIRQQYSADAKKIIAAHPWAGIGVGNYALATSGASSPTDDPHEVLLLQAAEGGYGLAALFVLLVVGSGYVLFKTMRSIPIGVAAAAVLIATAVHGLVDVYWVRGTPVLGWLLVGMACGEVTRRHHAAPSHER